MDSVLRVPRSIHERAILLDTGAVEAIVDPKDQYHQPAVQCRAVLLELACPLYITTLTIAETHRRLLYKPHLGHRQALNFLEDIYSGSTNIVRSLGEDELRAKEYVSRFADQKLTFTDTVNMAVMRRIGLRKVFSFDWHFRLLGFQVVPPF
jgi:predicted nucleic acid-binding protein